MKKKTVRLEDLYRMEKSISLTDDKGNTVELILKKMTRPERKRAIEILAEAEEEAFSKIIKREKKTSEIYNSFSALSKSEIIDRIINFQSFERAEIADLFPSEDEKIDGEKLLEEWKVKQRQRLKKESLGKLKKTLLDFTLRLAARLEAMNEFNNYCIYAMTFYPDNTRAFSSPEKVNELREPLVYERLKKEIEDFRNMETAQQIREAANSPDFTKTGGLQEK